METKPGDLGLWANKVRIADTPLTAEMLQQFARTACMPKPADLVLCVPPGCPESDPWYVPPDTCGGRWD